MLLNNCKMPTLNVITCRFSFNLIILFYPTIHCKFCQIDKLDIYHISTNNITLKLTGLLDNLLTPKNTVIDEVLQRDSTSYETLQFNCFFLCIWTSICS